MAMETRVLGRTKLEVSVIGLGGHLTPNRENLDAVFDVAVSGGVNYLDLIFPIEHANFWEAIIPALRRHRNRLVVAVHWGSVWHEPLDRCQRDFDRVLDILGNDYAEIAMPSLVDTETLWNDWAQPAFERLRRYQRDGRVGFIGLANHNVNVARIAVESGLIDVLMFPVNLYQHHEDPARTALLEVCATHEVGVVAMKPYHGGLLLTNHGRPTGITPTQCLHYVLSQRVATAVPGVRDAYDMRQALHYLEASAEEKQYAPLHDELTDLLRGQCVRCGHCLPCPQEINIPSVIRFLTRVEHYSHGGEFVDQWNRQWYSNLPAKGSDCTECEVCLERCPFDVDIISKMHRAVEVFETTV